MTLALLSPAEIEEQFIVRPATLDDVEIATALFNKSSVYLTGIEEFDIEDTRREWTQENLKVEDNMRLVFTPDGELVGYIETWDLRPPHTILYAWLILHPDYENAGIGEYLMQWAEQRLRQTIVKAPEGAEVWMRMGTLDVNTAVHRAAESIGMTCGRHFFKMGIEFDGPPPAPVWPEGIHVRTWVVGQDDEAIYRTVDTAFKDHWGHVDTPFEEGYRNWRHWVVERDDLEPDLTFLAVDENDKILGVSYCESKRLDMPDYGWLATLGVLREGRGKGIGLGLLLHTFGEFYRRGKKGCGLGVDAENLTGALRLYTKAGMAPVGQWDNFGKILREGYPADAHE
ncbi:MAG: GNAT family N-acetyltransferase [Anaerolineae bacterium]|nr:GNAT family N-acetyltransferase [Anaerolineae bacterium]